MDHGNGQRSQAEIERVSRLYLLEPQGAPPIEYAPLSEIPGSHLLVVLTQWVSQDPTSWNAHVVTQLKVSHGESQFISEALSPDG